MLSVEDKQTIDTFLKGRLPNQWLPLFNRDMEIYARRGYHGWNGKVYDTFDLANIIIREDYKRGQGKFTQVLEYLEPQFNIYVEAIYNKRLLWFLAERGYAVSHCKQHALSLFSENFKWGVDKTNGH